MRSQLLIAGGATLAGLGLLQPAIRQSGVAVQCRVTTEDPAHGFRPDSGTISAFRAPGGAGVRLDEGSTFAGAEVLPEFQAGRTYTSFVDERRWLSDSDEKGDRASKLLRFVAETTVNQSLEDPPIGGDPREKLEPVGPERPPGSRQLLQDLGAEGLAAWLRDQRQIQLTDTTMRDAHQSLLATRIRTFDMVAAAPYVGHNLASLFSLEVWGGATFDVAMRFLGEDPWERLAAVREAIPNICLQICCAAAISSVMSPTASRLCAPSSPRPRRRASTSSGSSTP